MMNGGNILVLRDILGHADISMTMRYAHFAPDHLTEAVTLNPIASFTVATCHFLHKKSRFSAAFNTSIFPMLFFTVHVVFLLLYTDECGAFSQLF